MDIVVTLPKYYGYDHLLHKNLACQHGLTTWWKMKRLPKKLNFESKIFIVFNGEIEQYFTILDINENKNKIYLDKFRNIKIIKMKGFQGFRYRKFEFQEIN